jgi:phosphotriesterase-related protein
MVLSHDAAWFSRVTPPSWRARNTPHWHHENLARRIVPRLLAGGASEEDLHQMLVLNPARVLTPATGSE